MALRHILQLLYLSASSLALPEQTPLILPAVDSHGPSVAVARDNGAHIFNALHSSMRQWGSSLKHNGMSFFPASIPAGTALYHGTHTQDPVKGMEWLAFEIEHAEQFARSFRGGPGGPGGRHPPGGGPGRGPPDDGSKPPPLMEDTDRHTSESPPDGPGKAPPGYLHTYRASRDLSRLLYIDGMSAGKTSMGTLDSQDIVLRNETTSALSNRSRGEKERISGGPMGERERAAEMCALGAEWGIEGFVRMEAGFELILCNFTDGLDFVSARQRPEYDQPESYDELRQFEFMRGIAARYQGITAERVILDQSRMVSAFFYPLNLTNPDKSRAELPRLVSADLESIARLRSDLQKTLSLDKSEPRSSIDWQGVTDMIVGRYTDRLQYMASESATPKTIQSEINFLLTNFIDYNSTDIPAAKDICAKHYLRAVEPTTPQDHLIYEAILSVSRRICNTLFEVRDIVLQPKDSGSLGTKHPKKPIKDLISYLDWSTWLECGKCAYDEVCLVAIWPWGNPEDHYHPSCLQINETSSRRGYWNWEH